MGKRREPSASTGEPTQPPTPADEPVEPPPPDELPGSPGQLEEEPIVEEPGAENAAAPTFDIDAFVRELPAGVCLCPTCLGMGAVIEAPPFDPHTHVCPSCQGHGRTRTGGLNGSDAERACVDCGGHGWQPNEPGVPDASPARPLDFQQQGTPRDYAGRTPDDPEFDWARVVHIDDVAEPAPVEPAPVG